MPQERPCSAGCFDTALERTRLPTPRTPKRSEHGSLTAQSERRSDSEERPGWFGGASEAPRDDRAMKAERVEQLADESLRGSFSVFRNEIEGTVFDDGQRRLLAEMADVQSAWQFVLAWLTRDQECRIDGLTHWRHPESSSQSPVRNAGADTRLNVLRVATGLYSETSRVTRNEVTQATGRAEATRTAARRIEARFNLLRDDLQAALGVEADRIWPPVVELFRTSRLQETSIFNC